MSVILIGFKNCGKTSVGRELAKLLGWEFMDTDQLLSPDQPIAQLYQQLGEGAFREREAQVIENLQTDQPSVIAIGGGALGAMKSVRKLQQLGRLIYLRTEKEILLQRSRLNAPSFIRDDFDGIYLTRTKQYDAVADYIVDVSDCDVNAAACKIREVVHGE